MRHAQAAGATAALVLDPYYNRPSQEGMIAHFHALAAASDLPIVPYNPPGHTPSALPADTTSTHSKLLRTDALQIPNGHRPPDPSLLPRARTTSAPLPHH